MITLPALLAVHADALLGEAFVQPSRPPLSVTAEAARCGRALVRASASAGQHGGLRHHRRRARRDDPAGLRCRHRRRRLDREARERPTRQQRLLELFGADMAGELQATLKPWLARRTAGAGRARTRAARAGCRIASALGGGRSAARGVARHLLGRARFLNAIPVKAGDVIYNATPARIAAASGKPPSAEVHALGNPEGRGVFALEIRRPGPTFRAWDNVRFPLRDIDIEDALEALNLTATRAAKTSSSSRTTGAARRAPFRRLRVLPARASRARRRSLAIDVPARRRTACMRSRAASACARRRRELGALERGESALVPAASARIASCRRRALPRLV